MRKGLAQFIADTQANLQEIAEMTGGELLEVDSTTSLQMAIKKAITNIRYQYTLGFSPLNPGETGSYHTLDVRLVSQDRCPGCQVYTRKGYYTGVRPPISPKVEIPPIPEATIEKTNELLVQRSILTAGATMLELPDIPFTVKTAEQIEVNGQPQLNVYLKIDPAGIAFKKVEGNHACNLQIVVFYADKKGKILGNDWKSLESAFSEEDYGRVMKEGILYKTTIPILGKDQKLKVVVYDEASNKIGSESVHFVDGPSEITE